MFIINYITILVAAFVVVIVIVIVLVFVVVVVVVSVFVFVDVVANCKVMIFKTTFVGMYFGVRWKEPRLKNYDNTTM